MGKELKPLDEYNSDRRILHSYDAGPRRNGIACPRCAAELLDTSPMITLTSDPPQKEIGCSKCGYRGYRIA